MANSILVLGSGFVAGPLIEALLRTKHRVIVASNEIDWVKRRYPPVTTQLWAYPDLPQLVPQIRAADVVVSLLPATMHVDIAKLCLDEKRHLVTASYVSPAMAALSDQARSADILLLNEVGLDPGLDHMSAMATLADLQSAQWRIVSFCSHCGGIPAPSANKNPWGYKFSWSPLGVFRALNNQATLRRDGEEQQLSPEHVLEQRETVTVPQIGRLESYANRDALHYARLYGIEDAATVYRGTLRYPGWCETALLLRRVGLFSDRVVLHKKWCEFWADLLGLADQSEAELRRAVVARFNVSEAVLDRLAWAGMFGEEQIPEAKSLVAATADFLSRKMAYQPEEQDMVVMLHQFDAEKDQTRTQVRSSLVICGDKGGHTAMAKTVGLPLAAAVEEVLSPQFALRGVVVPTKAVLYEPILKRLAAEGIVLEEERRTVTVPV